MWESPIDIIYNEAHNQIKQYVEEQERTIVKAIQSVGVNVDKDELVRALMYDRQQYEKGYADAKAEHQWIPCSERLPEEGEIVLTQANIENMISLRVASRHDYNYWKGWNTREVNVVAWMPLPEPYKVGE